MNLDEIKNLKDNWNGYGAEAFSEDFIEKVEKIVEKLNNKPDDIFPTAADSIQLEYGNDEGLYLEVDIENDLSATIYFEYNSIGYEFREEKIFAHKIDDLVNILFRRNGK